jgi:hypothetical protein
MTCWDGPRGTLQNRPIEIGEMESVMPSRDNARRHLAGGIVGHVAEVPLLAAAAARPRSRPSACATAVVPAAVMPLARSLRRACWPSYSPAPAQDSGTRPRSGMSPDGVPAGQEDISIRSRGTERAVCRKSLPIHPKIARVSQRWTHRDRSPVSSRSSARFPGKFGQQPTDRWDAARP